VRLLHVVALAAVSGLIACGDEAEPTYQGKSARYWVDRLVADQEDATAAVESLGAACVPYLVERMPDDFEGTGWRVPAALRDMGRDAVPALLTELESEKARHRIVAFCFLLWMHDPPDGVLERCAGLLKDGDPDVRKYAALQLGGWEHRLVDAIPIYIRCLDDQDADTRESAASYLGCYPDAVAQVVPALVKATVHPEEDTARSAFVSLAAYWSADPQARTRILEAYASSTPRDREGAVLAMGHVSETTPDLAAMCLRAVDDDDRDVRDEAVEALRRFWSVRGVPLGRHRAALAHANPSVRRLACEAAGRYDKVAGADFLPMLDDPVSECRFQVLEAVESIGRADEPVLERLVELVDDRDEEHVVRRRAAWVLVGLDHEADRAVLFLAKHDDVLEVVARMGPRARAAAPELRAMLSQPTPHSVGDIAWALYVVTGETTDSLTALRFQMERGDWFAKLRACIYAARFGPAAAELVPVLQKLLDDEWYGVRRYAATALGYIGSAAKPAIPKLIELLDDHEPEDGGPVYQVSRHAAAALAYLGADTPKARALLAKILEECDANDGSTRPGALRYAWKRGLMPVKEVVELCTQSLRPPNWDDVPPIIRLLEEIGPEARESIPMLEKQLGKRYEIRLAAKQAIGRIRPR